MVYLNARKRRIIAKEPSDIGQKEVATFNPHSTSDGTHVAAGPAEGFTGGPGVDWSFFRCWHAINCGVCS
jgi:hypothetical protein